MQAIMTSLLYSTRNNLNRHRLGKDLLDNSEEEGVEAYSGVVEVAELSLNLNSTNPPSDLTR